jgi:urocanate hydratase
VNAFDYPGFVPAFIRPQFCEGRGPFRWVALSGDPADIARTDQAIRELFPDDEGLHRWLAMAEGKVPYQGLPARDLLAGLRRAGPGRLEFNRSSPPVRSARRSSSAATISTRARSPHRTARRRAMADGSDAVADWPLLNALVNTAAGATWVSIHHGGGGRHRLQPARRDGRGRRRTDLAARKLERVLTTDPGMGVVRHVDARLRPSHRRGPRTRVSTSRCCLPGTDERSQADAVASG